MTNTSTQTQSAQHAEWGVGMCVAMDERNGHDDSDFIGIFAVADDTALGGYRFEARETGSTRYGGGYIPRPDATDEVLAAYRLHRQGVVNRLSAERAERAAMVPDENKAVTVVKAITRGKNKTAAGETGVVLRRVVNQFDSAWAIQYGHRTYRVQVRLDADERVIWMDEERVRVTGYEGQDLPINMDNVDYVILRAWPAR